MEGFCAALGSLIITFLVGTGAIFWIYGTVMIYKQNGELKQQIKVLQNG